MQKHPDFLQKYNLTYSEEKINPVSKLHLAEYTPPTDISFLHYHKALELGICIGGSGVFFIDEQVLPFSEGDISVIYSGEIHFAKSNDSNPSKWIFISVDTNIFFSGDNIDAAVIYNDLIKSPYHSGCIIKKADNPEINRYINMLCDELREKEEDYHISAKALLTAIIVHLKRYRTRVEPKNPESSTKKINSILPALQHIAQHYNEDINAPMLASLCFCSLTQLRRLFAEILGCSPLQYMYNIRINAAIALLRNRSKSITEIAYEVGYNTLSSFNRHFKKKTGLSPGDYRRLK